MILEDSGLKVTRGMVFDLVERFASEYPAEDASRMHLAVGIFKELVTARDPPIFITTYLSNHSLFRGNRN